MNYPVWELFGLGGGTLIALVSVLHVYISHLAVGGGIFIWLTDRKALKENDSDLNDFLRRYNWVFLLVTMVLGGMTGVGIWWTISMVNPAGTSALIHNFVFGWAIEWVFFLGEIVALLVYHYYFDKLSRKTRLNIAFLYAFFAWMSLFIINGILSFMLTPGRWIETGNFWHGFLNPTYFSSLFFRTFITLMCAGIFAFLVGSYQKEEQVRTKVVRIGVQWLIIAMIGIVLTGAWYYFSVPEGIRNTTFSLNPQAGPFVTLIFVVTPLVLLLGLTFILKGSTSTKRFFAWLILIAGFVWMGSFEYIREIARKPYVIYGYMYSNGILVDEVDELNRTGFLMNSHWTRVRNVTYDRYAEAGEELFRLQCHACHTIGGRNDILTRTEIFPYRGLVAQLTGQGRTIPYMPPFAGTFMERDALATYIQSGLKGEEVVYGLPPADIIPVECEVPDYDASDGGYVLLVWNDLGMHCISDSDPYFVILPPANTLEAQLIRRGQTPQFVTEGVTLTYRVDEQYLDPASHVPFWEYEHENFGVELERNTGLTGAGLEGEFEAVEGKNSFQAHLIPVAPYPEDGGFNPYPQFTVEARNSETGEVLAWTRVIAPTSTEMGCLNCHGGEWRFEDKPGVGGETAQNILAAHDRINGTTLLDEALEGHPRLCQSCHADPALGAAGDPNVLNMSAAMHGWHANYIEVNTEEACQLCHPASPDGYTQCLRGIHNTMAVTCVDCHGTLAEHALSLLAHEQEKQASPILAEHLTVTNNRFNKDTISPRMPWLNEPDCLTCHREFERPPMMVSSANVWTSSPDQLYRMRTDSAGVRCEACHGPTHALYPAINIYSDDLDNMQPLQYQGEHFPIGSNYNCTVCHTMRPASSFHHPNTLRRFRNIDD